MRIFFLIFLLQTIFMLDPFSMDYTYNQDCPSDYFDYNNCLSVKNSTIMAKLKEYQSNHNCEKELNDLIRNNDFSNFEIGIKNLDDQLNLVAGEKISANETFFKIPLWQTISNKKIDYSKSFPTLGNIPYHEIPFANNPYQNTEEMKLIHNLLIAFYNVDHFIFKEELLCLPSEINVPFFSMTFYEQDHLGDKGINTELKKRSEWIDMYYYFLKIIGKNYDVNERLTVFGRATISLEDFLYTLWISLDKHFAHVEEKDVFIFLAPSIINSRFTPILVQNSQELISYKKLDEKKNAIIYFMTKKTINPNSPVLRKSNQENEINTLLIHGFVREKNEHHCFIFDFLEKKFADKIELPQDLCLSEAFLPYVKSVFNLANFWNIIDDKERLECQKYLSYILNTNNPNENEHFLKLNIEQIIDGKYCKHVEFTKYKFFEKPLENLKILKDRWKDFLNKVNDYINHRILNGLTPKNAVLLKNYYEKNLELAEKIEDYIHFFKNLHEERVHGRKQEPEVEEEIEDL